MNCSVIDCGAPAEILVRVETWTDGGLTLSVAWADWDRVSNGTPAAASVFCEPHAREHLARMPLLAPRDRTAVVDDVYTHG